MNIFKFSAVVAFISSTALCHASDGEAMSTFSNAASAALNFKNARMIEEISAALPHFTINGRSQLLSEFERTGIISEATKNNGSLQTNIGSASLNSNKTIGHDGLNMYQINGTAAIQWQRCIQKTCVPVGSAKTVQISGAVVSTIVNNRPSFKVNAFKLDGIQGGSK